jgi:23S rRNA pseudouridine955/2504/2580 synthase
MTKDNIQTVRQFTVGTDDNDIRLDRWFKRHLPQVGFATISRWARTGQIRVDGKRVAPEDRVLRGQLMRVPPATPMSKAPSPRAAPAPRAADRGADGTGRFHGHPSRPGRHRHQQAPGLATQGGTGTHEHVDGLLDAYAPDGPRPRLVHRLDKDTSGALLVAATPGSRLLLAPLSPRATRPRSTGRSSWACPASMKA